MNKLVPHSTPKLLNFEDIKKIGLPTSYIVETPNFYWTNQPDSNFLFEQIVELKQSIPTIKVFNTLKVSSFHEEKDDFFQGNTLESAKEFIHEHIKYQFELYLGHLNSKLNILSHKLNDNSILRFLYKVQESQNKNQLTIKEQIDIIKNKICIVSFFIENILKELVQIEEIKINNFILPNNIEKIKNQHSLFKLDLFSPIDQERFGLREVSILDLQFKYNFFFNRMEENKEVKLEFNLETESSKESTFVSFSKTNKNEFSLNSFREGLYYFFEREDAVEKTQLLISKLKESLS